MFISPEGVEINDASFTADVDTFPAALRYQNPDSSFPGYFVDSANPKVIHITNWQLGQQTLEDLVMGSFVDFAGPNLYRIVDIQYFGGTTAELFLYKPFTGATGAQTTWYAVAISVCSKEKSVMVRLEAGTAQIKQGENSNVSHMTTVSDRATWQPPAKKLGYVEPIMVIVSSGGAANALNSN